MILLWQVPLSGSPHRALWIQNIRKMVPVLRRGVQDLRQGEWSGVEGERGRWCNVLLRWAAGEVGLAGVDSANEETHLSRLHAGSHRHIPSMISVGQRCSRYGWGEQFKQLEDVELSWLFLIALLLTYFYIQSSYSYCAMMWLLHCKSLFFCCWAVVRICTLFIKWCEYVICVMNETKRFVSGIIIIIMIYAPLKVQSKYIK